MMIGSAAVAGWIAHLAFWVLLARVVFEVRKTTAVVFVVLWVGGYLVLTRVIDGALFFMPWVAVLDVALAFILIVKDA
jgi:hypothetical protein